MPLCTFKISGTYKIAVGIVEDFADRVFMIDLQAGASPEEIDGGGLAWFTLNASGNPGEKVEVEIVGATGNPACPKHVYAFGTNGKISRPFQFNPSV